MAFHRLRTTVLRRRSSRPAPRRMAPIPAPQCRARRSPLRRRSRHSACPLTADRAAHQPGQRSKRPASAAATNPRHGATFPRLSGATYGNATEDAAVIAIRSPGAAAPLPICCRSTTCCRSPKAVARSRPTSSWPAQPTTECATATDRGRRRSHRCSASSALLPPHHQPGGRGEVRRPRAADPAQRPGRRVGAQRRRAVRAGAAGQARRHHPERQHLLAAEQRELLDREQPGHRPAWGFPPTSTSSRPR